MKKSLGFITWLSTVWYNKANSESCAVAEREKLWRTTGQSNLIFFTVGLQTKALTMDAGGTEEGRNEAELFGSGIVDLLVM